MAPLFVEMNIKHEVINSRYPVGVYDPQAAIGYSHRAILVGKRDKSWVVRLPTVQEEPVEFLFAEEAILKWNEPYGPTAEPCTISGVRIDYHEPFMKALISAGLFALAGDLPRLDFTKNQETILTQQIAMVRKLIGHMNMQQLGKGQGYIGPKAAPLFYQGFGVSFVQRAVLATYLAAFGHLIGFEIQIAVGRTLRKKCPHGFLIVLFRPSLKRFVADPTWKEPLTDLDVAFFGPHWGHDRRLVGFEGEQNLEFFSPDDVLLDEV